MDSIEVLQELASQVRNAKQEGENTAERVGRLLEGIVERLGGGYFTLQTDANGMTYLHTEYSLAVMGGLTTFARSSAVVPSIFEGIPIDNDTIYWDESTGVRILKAKGSGGGSDFDATAMWAALSAATNEQINKSHLTDAFNGYATESWVEGKGYALQTSLDAVSAKLNDFLEGSDTDTIINKWKELEAFLSGMQETDNLAEILSNKADTTELAKYVTLATEQEITGLKHFINGLSIGATKHKIYEQDGVIYFDGDLAVTGGVTAYAQGSRTPSSILDGLIIDETTLSKEGGKLSVIGGVGGASNWDELEGKPSWIGTNKPSYNWSEIGSKPTTLGGYGITDAYTKTDSDNRFVNVTGDTITGDLTIQSLTISHNNEINSRDYVYLGYRDTINGVNVCFNNKPFTYGSSRYTIWHAGNDGHGSGMDADTIDGYQASQLFVRNRDILNLTDINNFVNRESGTYQVRNFNSSGALQSTGLLTVFRNTGASTSALEILTWYDYSMARIRMSIDSNRYTTWKDLAFIDSNVASATKLQTARVIWGQSFDGTGNVEGNINNVGLITPLIDNTYNVGTPNNTFRNVYTTWVAGGIGRELILGANNSDHIWIKTNGNIGIGTNSPSQKLDVNGTARANSLASTNIKIECDNNGYFGRISEINNYNDTLYLQYNTSKHVVCCYGGGNLGIGTSSPAYKLHVLGNMQVTDFILVNRYASIPNSASIVVNKAGSYYLGIGSDGVNNTPIFGYCDANGNWEADYNMIFTFRGNILATGGITCYASDQRAKTVIEQINLSLKQIANAPTIRFKWNDWKIKDDGKTHIGGIAQYMQKLLPETVLEADGALNMDYATTGYIFAVQTAKHLVKTDTEVERLKKRVKKLEKQLKQLGYEEVNIMDD